jgi:hypothetical protein
VGVSTRPHSRYYLPKESFTFERNLYAEGDLFFLRKLASIQIISKLEPIEGADRIEKATVLGWNVVVQKGLYKEGDKVVYLEIDSILPKDLAERSGFTDSHLKTRRFKGVYSQGMCIPMSELPPRLVDANVGQDVTAELGITKWEPDQRNDDQWWKYHENKKAPDKWYMKFAIGRWFWRRFIYKPISGPFPTDLVPKTDETRCNVLTDVLSKYKGVRCQYTEKVDGSSVTFWRDKNDKFHVCSRNREIFNKEDFMYTTAEKFDLPTDYIFQGEILGPNIQGNKYGLKDYEIRVYQAYIPGVRSYLKPHDLTAVCKAYNLKQVPVLGEFELTDDIDDLVNMSIGMSSLDTRGKETQREGIVVRPLENIDGLYDSRFVGGRLSFKVINPKFLVKYDL